MHKRITFLLLIFALVLVGGQSNAQSGWAPLASQTISGLNSVACRSLDKITIACTNGMVMQNRTAAPGWDIYFLNDNSTLRDISFADSVNGLVCGENGTILRSTTFDSTWQTIRSGWMIDYYGAFMLNSNFGIVVGRNTVLQPIVTVTTNGWLSYEDYAFYLIHDTTGYEGYLTDVYFWDESTGIATASAWPNEGAIVKTLDGGQTWVTKHWSDNTLRAIDFPTADIGYAVGMNGRILKSVDGGEFWDVLPQQLRVDLSDVEFVNADTGWVVGESSTIERTDDGGQTWVTQMSGPDVSLTGVSFRDDHTGYVVGSNGTIFQTQTGGVPDVIPPGPFERLFPADHDTIAIWFDNDFVRFVWNSSHGSEGFPVQYTLYMSSDNFPIFIQTSIQTFDTTYTLHFPIPTSLDDLYPFQWRVVASNGADSTEASNGIGDFILDFRWEKAADPSLATQPRSYQLSCYPNPFNPTTTISFSLPEQGRALVHVFNITGQEVMEKDFGISPQGNYQMRFDAQDLPSGIYVARLQAGKTELNQKMVLIK